MNWILVGIVINIFIAVFFTNFLIHFTNSTKLFNFKSCQMVLVLIMSLMAIYSIFQQTPLQMIFGDAGCWVIYFLIIAHNTKAVLGIGHLNPIIIRLHLSSATEIIYFVKSMK